MKTTKEDLRKHLLPWWRERPAGYCASVDVHFIVNLADDLDETERDTVKRIVEALREEAKGAPGDYTATKWAHFIEQRFGKTPVRRRLTPRLVTNGPVATGEQVAAYSMARWISEHCVWTGDSFITGLEVGTSVDVITGRSSVNLGVILDVQPRDPAEVPDVIGAGARLTLNVISHFDMSEFEAQRRPAHELLPLFFRNAILDALEHETDECIDVDGERVFDPHAADRGMRRDPFRSVDMRSGRWRELEDAIRERLDAQSAALFSVNEPVKSPAEWREAITRSIESQLEKWRSEGGVSPVEDIAVLAKRLETKGPSR